MLNQDEQALPRSPTPHGHGNLNNEWKHCFESRRSLESRGIRVRCDEESRMEVKMLGTSDDPCVTRRARIYLFTEDTCRSPITGNRHL